MLAVPGAARPVRGPPRSGERSVAVRVPDRPEMVGLQVAGHSVRSFGPFAVYSVSPTYLPGTVIQEGNHGARRKLIPKDAASIRSNYIGLTPTRSPSSRDGETESH